jgi:ligand-binding SRPBCC domain-containing protein
MADYILERRVWLPRPRAEVFEFFADPRNLERLHPAWARPRWVTPPPARLAVGAVLDFRAAWLPGRWRVIVRELDAPYRFVDAQVKGPFARWEHRHRFEPDGNESCFLEDQIHYKLPFGTVGDLTAGRAS